MSKETETNEFAEISKLVDNIILQYREVRKDCDIPNNGWHSRTIERIAQPFLKGHFTLAVVGKVSSGKSTFINALLGCKGLLPTGHDQTTCGVTYIEYGEIPEVAITFGDGHKEFGATDKPCGGAVLTLTKNCCQTIHEEWYVPDSFYLRAEAFDF